MEVRGNLDGNEEPSSMSKRAWLGCLLLVGWMKMPATAREPLPKDSPVRTVCVACHRPGPDGRLTTIESIRTTPEGWLRIIKRMERSYGVTLTDQQREQAVRDLSWSSGLSPQEYDELERFANQTPHPVLPEAPTGVTLPPDMERTCTACHRQEVFSSQRRTAESWQRVPNFHLGTWPTLFLTHREMRWDLKAKEAATVLASMFPFQTSQWQAWKGPASEPPLLGSYLVSGRQDGYGDFQGRLEIAAGPDKDHVTIRQSLQREDGVKLELTGDGQVLGGYQISFVGKQGEDKIEGTLHRPRPGDALVLRWTAPEAPHIKASATAAAGKPLYHLSPAAVVGEGPASVWLYTPEADKLELEDISAGDLKPQSIAEREPDRVRVQFAIPDKARSGYRQVKVKGRSGELRLAVAPAVEFLKVLPDMALARLGEASNPAVGVKFEVRGYDPGPDGQRFTEDDVDLGQVDTQLFMEDYASTDWADDPAFVGKLESDGLFLPASPEPNPKRVRRTNTGDVWICARMKKPGSRQPLRARTLLRVVVPDYRKDL